MPLACVWVYILAIVLLATDSPDADSSCLAGGAIVELTILQHSNIINANIQLITSEMRTFFPKGKSARRRMRQAL